MESQVHIVDEDMGTEAEPAKQEARAEQKARVELRLRMTKAEQVELQTSTADQKTTKEKQTEMASLAVTGQTEF